MFERPIDVPGASLRLPRERDAAELDALIAHERERLAPWMPWAADQDLTATLAFIRDARRAFAAEDPVQAAIVVDGRIAGMCGVELGSRPQATGSLGYWIGAEWEGRGIVTAAARAQLAHAFGPWGLERVELRAAVGNVRSRATAERLGFVREGVLRRAERVGRVRHDLVVYSLLADEWAGAAGQVRGR